MAKNELVRYSFCLYCVSFLVTGKYALNINSVTVGTAIL